MHQILKPAVFFTGLPISIQLGPGFVPFSAGWLFILFFLTPPSYFMHHQRKSSFICFYDCNWYMILLLCHKTQWPKATYRGEGFLYSGSWPQRDEISLWWRGMAGNNKLTEAEIWELASQISHLYLISSQKLKSTSSLLIVTYGDWSDNYGTCMGLPYII